MSQDTENPVIRYLRETLGISAQVSRWAGAESLPYHVNEVYKVCEIKLIGQTFLLMRADPEVDPTPAQVEKHLKWIEARTGFRGIYAAAAMVSYNRKRLIERKIPFLVPGNQLYIPDLGLDLREYLKKSRNAKKPMPPAAQVLTLAYLLKRNIPEPMTSTELAERLPYSVMTMSRAIAALEDCGLVDVVSEQRERRARFHEQGRFLWDKARYLMRSPIQHRVYPERPVGIVGKLAGLTALAETTALNPPEREVRAITRKEWKGLQRDASFRLIPEGARDEAPVELEIWRYDPAVLSDGDLVDPLSLYLSMNEDMGERVGAGLERLIEEIRW